MTKYKCPECKIELISDVKKFLKESKSNKVECEDCGYITWRKNL